MDLFNEVKTRNLIEWLEDHPAIPRLHTELPFEELTPLLMSLALNEQTNSNKPFQEASLQVPVCADALQTALNILQQQR